VVSRCCPPLPLPSPLLTRARCNFIEWRDKKIVYKRYASLFFVACIDMDDNELIALEMIHLFVEVKHCVLHACCSVHSATGKGCSL